MTNCDRTNYDKMMLERYNPLREHYDDENKHQYHTAPFPTPRTKFDLSLNKQWCHNQSPVLKFKERGWLEGYHPQVSQDDTSLRTQFDINLNKKWSSVCK